MKLSTIDYRFTLKSVIASCTYVIQRNTSTVQALEQNNRNTWIVLFQLWGASTEHTGLMTAKTSVAETTLSHITRVLFNPMNWTLSAFSSISNYKESESDILRETDTLFIVNTRASEKLLATLSSIINNNKYKFALEWAFKFHIVLMCS